jgi:prophage regulatory protein
MTDQPERILRIKEILTRTGFTQSTLYRKIAGGSFPQQVKISIRYAGWRASAVKRWMMNQRSGSRTWKVGLSCRVSACSAVSGREKPE